MLKNIYTNCIPNKIKKNISADSFSIIIMSFLFWCFFAHGMTLTNKYSFQDDIYLFSSGTSYTSGRWFLGFLSALRKHFMLGDISLPLFNGVTGLFYLLCTVLIVITLFDLKLTLSLIMLPGIMVVFPVITGMLGYNFTFPYYMLALLLSSASVLLMCNNNVLLYALAVILAACSVGTYQAFIPFTLSILTIQFIVYLLHSETFSAKEIIFQIGKRITFCVGFILLYALINRIVLSVLDTTLSDYQSISSMQTTNPFAYMGRIKTAYREYIYPIGLRSGKLNSMFYGSIRRAYYASVALILIATIICIYKHRKKGLLYLFTLSFSFFLLPLAINFITVMCDLSTIHSLMVYSQCLVFILLLVMYEHFGFEKRRVYSVPLALLLLLVNVAYCKYDNTCYLKAELAQQRTIEYFSTLVSRIKSTPGYDDEYPVLWINPEKIEDKSLTDIYPLVEIRTIPYSDASELVNTYSWNRFLSTWCAYNPSVLDTSPTIENSAQVAQMPHYPDDGSIAIINNTLVVKF